MTQQIILLHGALGSAEEMEPLAEVLKANFEVLSFTFEGHDKSQSAKSFTMDSLAEQLRVYIEQEQLAPAALFGFSMGGYVATWLACQQPELVKQIITLGTKWQWNAEEALQESKKLNPEKIKEKVPKFGQYLEKLHGENWPQLMQHTAGMMVDLGTQPRLGEKKFKAIDIPVSVLLGEKDEMVSRSESEYAVGQLPKAKFEILAEQPHPIARVNSSLLAERIRHHIQD